MVTNMWNWIKSLFSKEEPTMPSVPVVIEHRGMKAYFDSAMIEEFKEHGIDYEQAFRDSVDEILDEEEEDPENPYR